MLKNHRHVLPGPAKLFIRHSCQVFSINLYGSGCRPLQKIHAANQCTFTGAAHTDDSKYIPSLNIQINVSERINRLGLPREGFIQMLNFNHWFQSYHPLLFSISKKYFNQNC